MKRPSLFSIIGISYAIGLGSEKNMKTVLPLLIVSLIGMSGCASPGRYMSPGGSTSGFERDLYNCKQIVDAKIAREDAEYEASRPVVTNCVGGSSGTYGTTNRNLYANCSTYKPAGNTDPLVAFIGGLLEAANRETDIKDCMESRGWRWAVEESAPESNNNSSSALQYNWSGKNRTGDSCYDENKQWIAAEFSNNIHGYKTFLSKCGKGAFSSEAKRRIKQLEN